MKKFISAILLFLSSVCIGQDFPDGMVVVEFNASFNKTNDVAWLNKLTDCETQRVDITADSRWASEYKIVVVPTLVIFQDGEEVERYQADLSFKLAATREEVQDYIDELVMSAF